MNFGIDRLAAAVTIVLLAAPNTSATETLRERMLRSYALDFGLVPAEETWRDVDPVLAAIGKELFESTLLSSNVDTACASCHLDRFGSADGLPVAIGVEGRSFGAERVRLGGDPQPRNTLPLWGRGGKGFDTLFWDGRVEKLQSGEIQSQYGAAAPDDDPLTVAAHLPPLQLGEMVFDRDSRFAQYEQESTSAAAAYADTIVSRLRERSDLIAQLATRSEQAETDIDYTDVAAALASFIARNFRLGTSRFHAFVFHAAPLTSEELRGGVLFYGKGQCALCHSGPYFSDLDFHTIAFPQFGFGANGFGVDYGRYNVTQNPDDLFAFRTPPLINVTRTAPYSHSGSVAKLRDAIVYHFDPLAFFSNDGSTADDREQLARRIGLWARDYPVAATLSEREIDDLVAFLGTLETESLEKVADPQ
ncbi:His-Xaa-Ser system-associated MauG-like protein [Poseidonocella sedimentorum]|uniref:Cytochrome c peroxidase n=1 Tax=Poseidonocella sedimentorum TaxID=871652 RepID=A0A1I6CW49_9RHOB|nr:His-Xaa-Ser system-associated MauG-like protein [Poseidonocella sedimentorum]SFQ97323.1 cytochrome c peroxidase [Poseidonocella sedimentorum]